jgi:hypothetical protein
MTGLEAETFSTLIRHMTMKLRIYEQSFKNGGVLMATALEDIGDKAIDYVGT